MARKKKDTKVDKVLEARTLKIYNSVNKFNRAVDSMIKKGKSKDEINRYENRYKKQLGEHFYNYLKNNKRSTTKDMISKGKGAIRKFLQNENVEVTKNREFELTKQQAPTKFFKKYESNFEKTFKNYLSSNGLDKSLSDNQQKKLFDEFLEEKSRIESDKKDYSSDRVISKLLNKLGFNDEDKENTQVIDRIVKRGQGQQNVLDKIAEIRKRRLQNGN